MVFRDRTDVGPERTKPTPNAEVLTNNFDKFTQRWKGATFNGVMMLSAAALSELQKLRKHHGKRVLVWHKTWAGN